MYSKSTTITLTEMQDIYDAGKNLYLIIENDSEDKIEASGTGLWYGYSGAPSSTYLKAWRVPRTSSDGSGDTLESIIQYMQANSLTEAEFKVSNDTQNQIVNTATIANIIPGPKVCNYWYEPDDDDLEEIQQ